jgi:hypothetical protein
MNIDIISISKRDLSIEAERYLQNRNNKNKQTKNNKQSKIEDDFQTTKCLEETNEIMKDKKSRFYFKFLKI